MAKQRSSTATAASAPADAAKKSIEADAEKKKAEEAAAKTKAAEEARAAAAKSDPRRTDQETTPKTQESAETLLANLNTKMEQLLKYAHNTTDNTYATVVAARGLTKDLFKSV